MNISRKVRRFWRSLCGKFLPRPSRIALLGIEGSGKTTLLKALNGRKYAHPHDDEAADRIESGVADQEILPCQYRANDGRHRFYDFIVEDYKGIHFGSPNFYTRVVDGCDGAIIVVPSALSSSNEEKAKTSRDRYLDVCAKLGNIRAAAILDMIPDLKSNLQKAKASDGFLAEIRSVIAKAGVQEEAIKIFSFTAACEGATQKEKREAEQKAAEPFLWLASRLNKSISNRWIWTALVILVVAALAFGVSSVMRHESEVCTTCGKEKTACVEGCTHAPCVCTNSLDTSATSEPVLAPTTPQPSLQTETSAEPTPDQEKLNGEVEDKIEVWKNNRDITAPSLVREYSAFARNHGKATNFAEATEFVAGRVGPKLIGLAKSLENSLVAKDASRAAEAYSKLRELCDALCDKMAQLSPFGKRWEVEFAKWFQEHAYSGKSFLELEDFRYRIAIRNAKLVVVNSDEKYQVALKIKRNGSEVWLIPPPANFDKKEKMRDANAMPGQSTNIVFGANGDVGFQTFDEPHLFFFVCRKGEKAKHLLKPVAEIRLCGSEPFFTYEDNKGIPCRKLSFVLDKKKEAEVQCWLYGTEDLFCPYRKLMRLK